jgi:hypothetical protein
MVKSTGLKGLASPDMEFLKENYAERHQIRSVPFPTVEDDRLAFHLAAHLAPRIAGRIVVEIGGGMGLLACHLGQHAARVWCIEADPKFSAMFVNCLYAVKPKNVSYLFGAASEFAGQFHADVAVFCSHSGIDEMRAAGSLFAPESIDVWGELIDSHPDIFDRQASILRKEKSR